jgi:hypothetical protein
MRKEFQFDEIRIEGVLEVRIWGFLILNDRGAIDRGICWK